RALRSHRRGRGFDYRQLHETLCIHSTAEGLFICLRWYCAISRFKGLIWGLPEVYLRFEGLMVK
ncbi:MAG: hypothetical protein KH082_04025, partial [Bifidobacterium longum]|nr:hypothetical protein [Bifidobacterium longum]